MPGTAGIFDFDNHYYEAPDAFTRYADRSLGRLDDDLLLDHALPGPQE